MDFSESQEPPCIASEAYEAAFQNFMNWLYESTTKSRR